MRSGCCALGWTVLLAACPGAGADDLADRASFADTGIADASIADAGIAADAGTADAQPGRDRSAEPDAAADGAVVPVLERPARVTESCAIASNSFADPGVGWAYQLSSTSAGPVFAAIGGFYQSYWAKAFRVGEPGALTNELWSVEDANGFNAIGAAELGGGIGLAWHVAGNTNPLRFARVDHNGAQVVAARDLPGTQDAYGEAALYSAASGQRAFLVYQAYNSSSVGLIKLAIVDANGALSSAPHELAQSTAELSFSAVSGADGLTITWSNYWNDYQMGFAVVDEQGAFVVAPKSIALGQRAARDPSIAAVPGGYLLAFAGDGVLGLARLSAAGDLLGPAEPLLHRDGATLLANGRPILVSLGAEIGLFWYEGDNVIICGERTAPFHFVALHPADLVPASAVLTHTVQAGILHRVRAAPLGQRLFVTYGVAYHIGYSFEGVDLTCTPQ
ncbi:MAG: hypothetical protein JXR83_14985 [Deltaproteobacteria bacterium]|nr:hypothetical protein [Deltaproteobacteria bacterium]